MTTLPLSLTPTWTPREHVYTRISLFAPATERGATYPRALFTDAMIASVDPCDSSRAFDNVGNFSTRRRQEATRARCGLNVELHIADPHNWTLHVRLRKRRAIVRTETGHA